MPRLDDDVDLRRMLEESRFIAVIGCSPRPARASHAVAAYLKSVGYGVRPVHPGVEEILGEKAYPSLTALVAVETPDLLDVFRRPDALPDLVEEALGLGIRRFWFQLGVRHEAAEETLLAAGADLVADRCALVEHRRLMGDGR
jgi:predicted CoA-binding protein